MKLPTTVIKIDTLINHTRITHLFYSSVNCIRTIFRYKCWFNKLFFHLLSDSNLKL